MSVKQDRTRARTPEDLERKYKLGKLAEAVEALKNAAENGKEDTEEVLPIEKGGTGATTAAAARSSLEITPENIGARPNTWMPSAEQVGARPNTWMPSASDVGAVPTSRKVNNKALSSDITLSASDVGARASTWMPTASDVGAAPASHDHGNYIPVSSGGINANTAYDGGLYMCVGGSLNLPSGSQYGSLLVLPYRQLSGNTYQDFVTQIFMPNGDDSSKPNSFFYRTSTKNAWNGWKEVAIKDDLSGYLPLSGGTLTGELNCKNINASNEYLSGSLYVGGKKSTTDGRNGVAFGASGNVTMQGADTPTLNFINASATSPQATIGLAGTINQLHFKSKGNMLFYPASANNTYFALLGNSMYHSTDNAVSCGASTKRWSTVYAGTGTINTSDRNEKENIRDIDEKYIRLFEKLRPVTYEFIGGNHDRTHIGYISQEVKEAMDEVGLTDLEFAGYCRDKKTEDVLDENGVLLGTKDVLDENGEPTYRYALRYAEFIALNTKMIQLQQKKIEYLEKKLQKLQAKGEGR